MKKTNLYLSVSVFLFMFGFSSPSVQAAPAGVKGVFDLTTVSSAYVRGYSGGFVTKAPDVFNDCKKFVDVLKNKPNDYYVVINGKEFKVGFYNVMDTPSYDENDVKKDGFNVSMFISKNKKTDNNYLSLDCAENTNSVIFAFVGDKFGEKWESKSDTEQSLSILSNESNLKKISTKGTYVQNGGSEWGGFTYKTPWKPVFNSLDKKLVLVSELANQEPKTFVSEYQVGGFANYAKCLKSNMPFCFKKVGNKLVMFARTGWGSKSVDFWTK